MVMSAVDLSSFAIVPTAPAYGATVSIGSTLDAIDQDADMQIVVSRIIDMKGEYAAFLEQLAEMGLKKIVLKAKKDLETRLYREYYHESLTALMQLVAITEIVVGDRILRTETDVLDYVTTAAFLTKKARENGFRKLQAGWFAARCADLRHLKKKGRAETPEEAELQAFKSFKSALSELLRRAVTNEKARNCDEVVRYIALGLKGNLMHKWDGMTEEYLAEQLNIAVDRIAVKTGITPEKLQNAYCFDLTRLKQLLDAISTKAEVGTIMCPYSTMHTRLARDAVCDCGYINTQ
jgi:hypothetical protein